MAPPGPPSNESFPDDGVNDDLVASGVLGNMRGDFVLGSGPGPFPAWALQPKRETGVRKFLAQNPEFDGRNTVIAIFDSGVDPGANGLQVTSDGKRKILDCYDASGASDIDTAKIVSPDENGSITGTSGRKLQLPKDCLGIKEFRIGSKSAFQLYPRSLKDRMVKERQEKLWDPEQRLKVAETTKKLTENKKKEEDSSNSGMNKFNFESMENELEMLSSIDKKFKESNGDLGPLYDVVLFKDSQSWVLIIDTSEEGLLEKGVRLRPYRETGEIAQLTELDNLNVCFNVFDEGKTIQLIAVCSSHGTHVASIAAGHFPGEPDKNGIAPGAQIVSVTIGDARLNAMETGTALIRAMTFLMQGHFKVDVINMSYGEFSHWSNTGRVGEMMSEVINKYGITWLVSAGNNGPALSTIGTPPDISTNSVIGVGAYVSPEMMVAMYSTREKIPGMPYTWSSRGPTVDGDRGVTICAPGGAITSVPPYTLRGSQLMNGTSMACPHACGAVSLLVSGLKSLSIPYSPFTIKRALMNSSLHLPQNCPFAQGHGLLQVDAAFAHLNKFKKLSDDMVRYVVSCGSSGAKGIHIRKPHELLNKQEIPVKIEPLFLDNENQPPKLKVDFNVKFAMVSTEPWVKCPDHLDMMFVPRHFMVSVDPTGLTSGPNVAYIKAFDVSMPQRGVVFEVAVTVIVPEPIVSHPKPHIKHENVVFKSGTIKRHFVTVPDGATWAVIRINSEERSNAGKFILHTLQLLPKTMIHAFETEKMFSLNEFGEYVLSFPVKGNNILEVCLAKWWAHIGNIECSYSVTFHGLSLEGGSKELMLHGAHGVTRFDVVSPLGQEEVQPELKLKNLVQNYRPTEWKFASLGERDVIPPNRQIYEIQLDYNFSIAKAGEITINLPWLSNVLYESEFESQLWMLYNSHKQLVACGDAYPSKWAVKVEKEEYTLKVHVRSERRDVLEKLSDIALLVTTKLPSSANVDLYSSFMEASTLGRKIGTFTMGKGRVSQIYAVALTNVDKYMKNSTQGQYLTGTLTLSKDEHGKKADVTHVKYILSEVPKKDVKSGGVGASKANKKTDASFVEALIDHKITWLGKLNPNSEEALALWTELKAEAKANQVQVSMARLTSFELDKIFNAFFKGEQISEEQEKSLNGAIDACEEILSKINLDAILMQSAIKVDARSDAQEIKKENEKQKNWYIEASMKKGMSLCMLDKADEASAIALDLLKITDATDSKVVAFFSFHAEKVGQLGRALKLAQHQLDSKPGVVDVEMRIRSLVKQLGWTHVDNFGTKAHSQRYPSDYQPF